MKQSPEYSVWCPMFTSSPSCASAKIRKNDFTLSYYAIFWSKKYILPAIVEKHLCWTFIYEPKFISL